MAATKTALLASQGWALKARRSFGATDTMILDLRLGDKALGEEVDIGGEPTFQVFARGRKKRKLVEIVRDGLIVYSTRPDAPATRFQFTDTDLKPGAGAYYLRGQQEPNGRDEPHGAVAMWVMTKGWARISARARAWRTTRLASDPGPIQATGIPEEPKKREKNGFF